MDAVVGLYSMPDASYGSAVSLSEVGGGALTDKWAILRETTSGPLGGSGLRFTYGTDKNQANNPTFMRINRDGNVGIGAADPWVYKLYVEGSRDYPGAVACVKNLNTNNGHGMHIENWSYGLTLLLSQQGSHPDGEIFRCDSYTGGWHSVFLLKNSGRVICKTLELEGGTDLAEPFEISAGKELPEGALVVIDEDNPGKLTLSERPYDTRVAGVISGAGGISPGVTLTQEKMFDQGQNVAIGGRVYCLADASYGSIKPGDMLTTSPTPGHAMKAVDRAKAYGAVIGKAMTSLDEGQGLVLVLVSLQ
jgi:hypothetical protein